MPTQAQTRGSSRRSATAVDEADDENTRAWPSCAPATGVASPDGSSRDHEAEARRYSSSLCRPASRGDGSRERRDLERGVEKSGAGDAHLVRWEGPDDAEDPKSWPAGNKWAAVLC
ncbi:hypothetical protein E4U42_007302, partial [Claviceps africana]